MKTTIFTKKERQSNDKSISKLIMQKEITPLSHFELKNLKGGEGEDDPAEIGVK